MHRDRKRSLGKPLFLFDLCGPELQNLEMDAVSRRMIQI